MTNLQQEVEDLILREHFSDHDVVRLGPSAVPILITAFETASGSLRDRRRRRSLGALGILGTEQAVDFLIATSEDAAVEGWLRRAAVRSLGPARQPRAVAHLESLLEHPEIGVRNSAVMALGRSSDPAARRALERVRKTDADARIRRRSGQLIERAPGRGEQVPKPDHRLIRD